MDGIWLDREGLQFRCDLPRPEAGAANALVRVKLAGICGTDLQLVKGYSNFSGIPGHEFVGEVVAAPAAEHLLGQRVVANINISCGQCALCLHGMPSHCQQRRVLGIRQHDGAFAQYVQVPVQNLYPVPDAVSDEKAVFAEPLAAALEILEQIAIQPQHRVLILGAGRLGQLIAQVFATQPCQAFVVPRYPRQRQLLEQLIEQGASRLQAVALDGIEPHSMDIVIEATGSSAGLQAALQIVRPRGTIVLKSTYAQPSELDCAQLVVHEISLLGSRCGPMDKAIEWLAQERVNPLTLLETKFPLHDIEAAFKHAATPGVFKVLLAPN